MNIVQSVFARNHGSAIALLEDGVATDFATLEKEVRAAAEALREALPAAGNCTRIGISIPNGKAHIVWSLAVLCCDWTLVPVPGELAQPEKEILLGMTAVAAVLAVEGQHWTGASEKTMPVSAGELCALFHIGIPGAVGVPEDALRAVHPALIRFSSGTTGTSKGVVISHAALLARVQACNGHLGIRPGDRVLWILPMAHHFAVSIMLYLYHGATTVLGRSHLAEDLLRDLRHTRATVLYGSPYHYSLLADCPGAGPLPDLRLAVSTAAALPQRTAEKFLHAYGLPVTQGYGIIEMGLPVLNARHALKKPLGVGVPAEGFSIAIHEPDNTGVGEILLRGPGTFDAYLHPWQPAAGVMKDGWFHSGDLGFMDADGVLFISGRTKSVINVAGLKCFPEEIEQVLNAHPAVAASRVVAAPHPDTGSIPVAEVVLRDPGQPVPPMQLIRHCRQSLAAYKVPLRYQFVTELPLTASGKLKR